MLWNLSNANRTNTRLLIKQDKTAGHKADKPLGWIASVRHPMAARAEHNPVEADLKEQHRWRQAIASKPEGAAVLVVYKEAEQITSAFKPSKIMGFTTLGGSSIRVEGSGGLP